MGKSKATPKIPVCILHTFTASPVHLQLRPGPQQVTLSWTSEWCSGYKFLLDHPGVGVTDVSSINSIEVEINETTTFALRVYDRPPNDNLLRYERFATVTSARPSKLIMPEPPIPPSALHL
jgi:hypothetical protein